MGFVGLWAGGLGGKKVGARAWDILAQGKARQGQGRAGQGRSSVGGQGEAGLESSWVWLLRWLVGRLLAGRVGSLF